jgi:phage host-nuclease inhibitor protein Gam
MKKRETVNLPNVNMTLEEAEGVLAVYAKADASIVKINAQMDLEIAKIREKHSEKLSGLQQEKDEASEKLLLFCTANKDEFFKQKKSLELSHGTLGFRTGTPALKTKKGFTWAAVLELAKQRISEYVRTKEELDKEALIAARNLEGMAETYDSIGVYVDQTEKWFVELKKEGVEA